jgi:hypothetical protein
MKKRSVGDQIVFCGENTLYSVHVEFSSDVMIATGDYTRELASDVFAGRSQRFGSFRGSEDAKIDLVKC